MFKIAALFGSLKLRVTLIAFVALSLGMGALLAMVIRQTERDTLAVQQERQLAETARTASLLSRRIVELQLALRSASSTLTPGVVHEPAKLYEAIQHNTALASLFTSVIVTSRQGHMLLLFEHGRPAHPRFDVTDRDYFKRTRDERRSIVSGPVAGRESGDAVVVLTHPLIDEAGFYGMVAGTLRLTRRTLVADLVDPEGYGDGDLVVVTDSKGLVLGHSEASRLLQPLATEPRLSEAFDAWTRAGAAVEPTGLRFHQTGQIVSAAGVSSADWMVWRALPEAAVLAPLEAARARALGLGAALLLAVSLLMFAVLAWLMRPLSQLERRAQHLFDETPDVSEGWPRAIGEIGRLSMVLQQVGAERLELERYSHELLRRLGSVMSAAPLGLAFTRKGRLELVSAEFCRMLGHAEAELLGRQIEAVFVSQEDHASMQSQMCRSLEAGQPYVGDWRLLPRSGELLWVKLRVRPVDWNDSEAGSVWTFNDVTKLLVSREQLQWSATHDALTGLANRKLLEPRLQRLLDERPASLPAVLVMVDLDHFKPINDEDGHAAGDEMLKAVATAMGSRVRSSDLVARTGGDEFVVLLEHCSEQTAARLLDGIHASITGIELPWGQKLLGVGASIGVAELRAETADIAAWLAEADAACYLAKHEGRGTVRWSPRIVR